MPLPLLLLLMQLLSDHQSPAYRSLSTPSRILAIHLSPPAEKIEIRYAWIEATDILLFQVVVAVATLHLSIIHATAVVVRSEDIAR